MINEEVTVDHPQRQHFKHIDNKTQSSFKVIVDHEAKSSQLSEIDKREQGRKHIGPPKITKEVPPQKVAPKLEKVSTPPKAQSK
jgi:hypothetical protein